MDCKVALAEYLKGKGEELTPGEIAEVSDYLQDISGRSLTRDQFFQEADAFMKDTEANQGYLKAERIMYLGHKARVSRLIDQPVPGISSYQKVLGILQGGERRLSDGLNRNTKYISEGWESIFLTRLQKGWGRDGIKIVESGEFGREFLHELQALESPGEYDRSKEPIVRNLMEPYYDVMSSMFATKKGMNPRLEKIPNYFFRNSHSPERIQPATTDHWIDVVLENFDIKHQTEETQIEYLATLKKRIEMGNFSGGTFDGNMNRSQARERIFIPKSADSFYNYNSEFGKTNVGTALVKLIQTGSREIAIMSQLSSRPRDLFDFMVKRASRDPEFVKEYKAKPAELEAAFSDAMFYSNAPAHSPLARIVAGNQKLTAIDHNGKSLLASFSDFAVSTSLATDINGGSFLRNFTDGLTSYWSKWGTSIAKNDENAMLLGVGSKSFLRNLHIELGSDAEDPGLLSRMLQFHSWASFMEKDTSAKRASMAEFLGSFLATVAETPWAELPAETKAGLARYTIGKGVHSVLKHGVFEHDGGKYFSIDKFLEAGEKSLTIQAQMVGADPKQIEALEHVKRTTSRDPYQQEGNPYFDTKDNVLAPRPDEGVNLSKVVRPYDLNSAVEIASDVHRQFLKSGYTEAEAKVPAQLFSTFLDTIGRKTGKDPLEIYKLYGFNLKRIIERGETTLGYMRPEYANGQGAITIASMRNTVMDSTVIHESAHFFLEVLRDLPKTLEDGPFKESLNGLFTYLGADGQNVTVGGHEKFVNSFELYMRSNTAPKGLEDLYGTIRDWYRRSLYLDKKGLAPQAFSKEKPIRSPGVIEDFYHELLGAGNVRERRGELTSLMETMPQETLLSTGRVAVIPAQLSDIVSSVSAMLNEHADAATTTPSSRNRLWMYGGTNIDSVPGAMARMFWTFKGSAVSQSDSMMRSFYSNPAKPQGDFKKIAYFMLLSGGLWAIKDVVAQLLEGKTPEPMNTPHYAGRMLIGSGGLGAAGEAIMGAAFDQDNPKDALFDFLKGVAPSASIAADAAFTAFMAAKSTVNPGTKFPANDVARVATQNIPFIGMFYSKALLNHYILDAAREWGDPRYGQKQVNRAEKRGQRYFLLDPSKR